jgi:acetyl-CoA acyltransferase
MRRIFVAGGAHSAFLGKGHPDFIWKRHPDFGKRENPDLMGHLGLALEGLKTAVGIEDFAEVDRAYIGNFLGELFISQGHLGAALAGADPSLAGKPSMRVEGACASGGLAALCAVDAIGAGADVALVTGAEIQTTASADRDPLMNLPFRRCSRVEPNPIWKHLIARKRTLVERQ